MTPGIYYYKITEMDAEDTLINDTAYVVAVEVSKEDDGSLSASIVGKWKSGELYSGENLEFVNTLVGELTLSKKIAGAGANRDHAFDFTVTLEPGSSGLDELALTYPALLTQQNGEQVEVMLQFRRVEVTDETGKVRITYQTNLTEVKDGESATIYDIPYGVKWTTIETDTMGYTPGYSVNGGEAAGGTTSDGTIVVGGTEVIYTNTMAYELPETGGAGTSFYTIGGALLMLGAALLLYKKAKRGKEVP